jgi:hypothetical protein
MDLENMVQVVDWIQLARENVKWNASVKAIMNFRTP